MQQNRVYVGNVPYATDERRLRELFSRFGEIEDIALIRDRVTGRPKGFGFVTFESSDSAEKAVAHTGYSINGRPLTVNLATERPGSSH